MHQKEVQTRTQDHTKQSTLSLTRQNDDTTSHHATHPWDETQHSLETIWRRPWTAKKKKGNENNTGSAIANL